ncbi:MAG: peptide chain release factor N(5)-glutamine methyltransferase [Deltaproteobacteria bacterium]|nr:peptide chain release factor N(5)-glutamine methyltransferase [Deltaproteobacteria bacterium]
MAWTVRSAITWGQAYLSNNNIENARLDAEVLLSHVLSQRRIYLFIDPDKQLTFSEISTYRTLLTRRTRREPIAYITGKKEFYSRSFNVNGHVLIPRPETELLVDEAIKLAKSHASVLEIGVGSGALIISILALRKDLVGFGSDISFDALRVARENAIFHGVADRLHLFAGDTLNPLAATFELIVVNPPYIKSGDKHLLQEDVALYEPARALFGGKDGLNVIKAILMNVDRCLGRGGRLIMEIGDDLLKPVCAFLADRQSLVLVSVLHDLAGMPRAIVARKENGQFCY